MTIFDFQDYRAYIRQRQRALPKRGWGFISQLANHIRVSQVQVSQVMSRKKDFTLEQAILVAEFLALLPAERDYFVFLVMKARAGNGALSRFSEEYLESIRKRGKKLAEQVPADVKFDEKVESTYYSHYLYSAIRLFTSIGRGKTLEEIERRFRLDRKRAVSILDFLTSAGLCEKKSAHYRMRQQRTYVGRDSPNLARHHGNWRLLGLQSQDQLEPEEIMITSPISLSREDFALIRERLQALVKELSEIVRKSESEIIVCWNLDWFELKA